MPLTQVRYQPFFYMVPYLNQRPATVPIVKVSDPTSHGRINLIHYPVNRHDRPLSLGELGDPVFDRLQRFLRWLDMGIISPCFPALPHPDREPQKVELPFIGIDGFRLRLIQGKP